MTDTKERQKAGAGPGTTWLLLAALAAAGLAAWAPPAAANTWEYGYVCYNGSCYCGWNGYYQPCGPARDFGLEGTCNNLVGGYGVDGGQLGPFLRRIRFPEAVADDVQSVEDLEMGLPCPHTASEAYEFCWTRYGYRPLATEVADDVFPTPDHALEYVGYYSFPVRKAACDEVPWAVANCDYSWYVDWDWQARAHAGCSVRTEPGSPVRSCWIGAGTGGLSKQPWYPRCTDPVAPFA